MNQIGYDHFTGKYVCCTKETKYIYNTHSFFLSDPKFFSASLFNRKTKWIFNGQWWNEKNTNNNHIDKEGKYNRITELCNLHNFILSLINRNKDTVGLLGLSVVNLVVRRLQFCHFFCDDHVSQYNSDFKPNPIDPSVRDSFFLFRFNDKEHM